MILAQPQQIHKAQKLFDELVELVQQGGDEQERVDVLERKMLQLLLKMGFELLDFGIERCGDGNLGRTIEKQGKTLRRLKGLHPRRYVSIFGEHAIRRYVYAVREGQRIEHAEVDQQLGLPEGDFSYVLQDWLQRFCIKESFQEAASSLETLLGLRVSVRSAEHMNQHLAQDAEAFRVSQPPPDPEQEAELLVYVNDCKGVPMRRPLEERVRRGVRRAKGEKANKKQMACVGAGYSVERFVRTADDVLDEVMRKQRADDRPRPQNKRMWAELTRVHEGGTLNGKTCVFVQQALDLAARDPEARKTVVTLMDGEKALRAEQEEWLPRGVGVLDIWHVIERLWAVAYCFHAEQSREAETFVTQRLRMLLEGKVGYVIGHFRRLLKSDGLRGSKKPLQDAVTYFENNRAYMKYDEYLAGGFPIGSGVAEGACRHVVKDRMELTGMRWQISGAQSMLHLRAIYLNDDWDDYLEHHIQTEQTALYGKKAA